MLFKFVLILAVLAKLNSCYTLKKGKLLWSDEFQTGTEITANWDYQIGRGPNNDGWGSMEIEYYTENNVAIKNDVLVIEARKEQFGGCNYTSSRIQSKKSFKYGIMEIRAKVPESDGLWPAFFLFPAIENFTWPDDGEIDIMEQVGRQPNEAIANIHTTKFNRLHRENSQMKSTRMSDISLYHVFGLEWTENKIEISVDGRTYFVYNKEEDTYDYWPFNANEFKMVINMAVGGELGYSDVDDSELPASYNVDYVRHYEIIPDPKPVYLKSRKITLRAKVNGRYLSIDKQKNDALIADKDLIVESEIFEIEEYTNDIVILKSFSTGKILTVEDYGRAPMKAVQNTNVEFQQFRMKISEDRKMYSFKSVLNSKYMSCHDSGIYVNRFTVKDKELFLMTIV